MSTTISCERCKGSGHIASPSLLSGYEACPDCDANGYLVTEPAASGDLLSRAELVRYFRTEEYADEIADIISNFPPAEHLPGIPQGARDSEELAYECFKFLEWRSVVSWRDDFIRGKWAELPDETTTGPCNVDCSCDHNFHGKNHYRELATYLLSRPMLGGEHD